MTDHAVLASRASSASGAGPIPPPPRRHRPGAARSSRGFSYLQLLVLAWAIVAPTTIFVVWSGYLLGTFNRAQLTEVVLGAGEIPGMVTFGLMFLCSPMQWFTGRSQVRVRKFLGIVFFGLALSNGAMFVYNHGWAVFAEPLLVAGSVALLLALPLFITSNRCSQRVMGMRRWRLLHKLTYLIAVALLAHVIFVADIDVGSALIGIGFIARVPAVRRRLIERGRRRRSRVALVSS